ncbi:hypothetical protein J3R30DRAFT_2401994 [Lentinula aciculospora]|uniref:Metallo-beta-lactamase domain-containing protein n=1 Tax=Lentinula aciculospora TaxID=153920 RepID=A0A9W9AFP7_9AGAR|nr:hypothetical protein J3R30DRAFT_2401994 [Lentinula aciculospora]
MSMAARTFCGIKGVLLVGPTTREQPSRILGAVGHDHDWRDQLYIVFKHTKHLSYTTGPYVLVFTYGNPSGCIQGGPAPACSVENLPEVDAVVISHNHFDRLDGPTITKLASPLHAPHFFAPLGNLAILESQFHHSKIALVIMGCTRGTSRNSILVGQVGLLCWRSRFYSRAV